MTFDDVCAIALALPKVEEGTSYGTAALKVKGTLFARLKEDGVTLVLRTTPTNRDLLLLDAPTACFITDHYRDYPWVLVRLGKVRRAFLQELIVDAWKLAAPARLVRAWEGAQ